MQEEEKAIKDAKANSRKRTRPSKSRPPRLDPLGFRRVGNEVVPVLRTQQGNRSASKAGPSRATVADNRIKQFVEIVEGTDVQMTEIHDGESVIDERIAFLANLSHEIRTPMNAIIGMAEIAKTTDNPQRASECIDKISAASRNLLRIINDTLDMTKIAANKYTLYEEPFAFSEMLRDVTGRNFAHVKGEKHHLKIEVDERIPQVIIADELRLSQVIGNLLGAAVRCTPVGGNIELNAELVHDEDQSARLKFTVADDGVTEERFRLLGAVSQPEAGFPEKFGGSGLGLAVSQEIVALMGGLIRFENNPGKGGRFVFEIDVRFPAEQPAAGGKPEQPAERAAYDFSGYTILFAEDVEINREVVFALLEHTGVRIECAENGQIAVHMYAADPDRYNMIYMDIQMPVLDGYAAARKIRAMDENVPIIAMTADVFADDVQKCKRAGMDDHIAKPIDFDECVRIVKKHCGV